jgi:hypothetical protein
VPILVQVQDEDGNPDGVAWSHPRSTELLLQADSNSTCLRFIDPYGDTTFNQLQIPVLIEELRALNRSAADPEAKQLLADLIAYVQKALKQVHTYVKFTGD